MKCYIFIHCFSCPVCIEDSIIMKFYWQEAYECFFYFLVRLRKRKDWDVYGPMVDLLSNEEVDALEAREERNARSMI